MLDLAVLVLLSDDRGLALFYGAGMVRSQEHDLGLDCRFLYIPSLYGSPYLAPSTDPGLRLSPGGSDSSAASPRAFHDGNVTGGAGFEGGDVSVDGQHLRDGLCMLPR